MLKYYKVETEEIPLIVWIGVAAGIALAVIIFIVVLCWCRRSRRKQKKHFKSLEVQMNNLESKVARECREAFAELQTDVTDLTSDLSTSGMPILDFKTYALHVLFPGLNDHPVLNKNKDLLGENWEKGLRQFSQLICNKKFLLVFIRTLELQPTFQMKDRCNVASLLMVALQAKMEYATEILKDLLCELIRKSVAKSHPKLLLRRTESVAEKMLTNWLAFCMYHFLKNDAGEPLFMLFKAVKQQAEKGPVDAVTGEARYSLSEDKLLRQAVDFKPLGVSVSYNGSPAVAVVLLDCDTISQAKDKILDVVFKNSPFSSRPLIDDLRLEWDQSSGRVLSLRDDDSQSLIEGEWRKINTLRHYQVTDNATLRLVTGQTYFYSSTDSELNKKNVRLDIRVGFSPGGSYSPLAFGTTDGPDEGGRLWHLVKQLDYPTDRADDDRNSKFVSEIYLTRLLKTKGTIQQFVDRLFHTVFKMNRRGGSSLPPVIKFLFDLLDAQAKELNLTDPEVLHTWKNNSLPLRFWINIIKNPNFIFDVCKSTIVDSCLSVIAQLFMDSCSVSEQVLDKDSPSNKLLYAREIPGYRQDVERFYADIQASPAPTPQELSRFFTDLSTEHGHEFNADHALQELYDYVKRYQDQLQEALEDSELSSLASKLEHVIATISDD
ncbi:plexin-A1-like [Montipora foliosa]|uniref:plexin-A1-like n=1 Tax=Montipora foliosa TaxID=591990 RepID=UPI0035F18975